MTPNNNETSSIYGPVDSWRFGKSLGVDLIMDPSTCSFNCVYCQLGFIQKITTERKIYVPTEKVINDFRESNWKEADVITFSGSGEPTLAANIGEVIKKIKELTATKITILTNGTLFHQGSVRKDILNADIISVKLDAPNEKLFQLVNRPAKGISLDLILQGINLLKKDIKEKNKKIKLQTQIMFLPQNVSEVSELAKLLNEIKPDEVALNTPTRPYPSGWDIITRGAHGEDAKKIKFKTTPLKTLTLKEVKEIEEYLTKSIGIKVLPIYHS